MENIASSGWLVLRFSASNWPKIRLALNANALRHFYPMRIVTDEDGKTKSVPALPGYVFVRGTMDDLLKFKREEIGEKDRLKFAMDAETGKPRWFSDELFSHFMKVAEQFEKGIEYLDPAREVNVKHGPKVRVAADGPFFGVEGEYVRVRSNRCVVVRLGGLLTVATPFIKPDAVVEI
ncbi:MAG: hypothetical protein KBT32_09745 [Bacteroidales bacterium]|nr:hypothetical protein [Candidatus Physcocola equi]